jgi:hypothetical protein
MKKEGCPFVLEDAQHGGIKGWSIAWPERHDNESVLLVDGSKKCELFLVAETDRDLVISRFIVQTDEKEPSSRVAEIINGVVSAGNGLERNGNLVETTVADSHSPNEVQNVQDMLLMRFGC